MDEYIGRITRHLFKSPDKSYAVSKFKTSPDEQNLQQEFIITGPLKRFSSDAEIQITGKWETHAKYGLQFAVATAYWKIPKDRHKIREHLERTVRGVGKKTIAAIVDFFGESTLEVLRTNPKRIEEVSGVSKGIAKKLLSGVRKDEIIREIDIRLGDYQFPPNAAQKIYDRFGSDAQAVLNENPYALVGIEGIQFRSADRFAQNSGSFDPTWIRRVEAFILGYVREESSNGHSCVSIETAVDKAMRECSVPRETAEQAIVNLTAPGENLVMERMHTEVGPVDLLFLPWNQHNEIDSSRQIGRLLYSKSSVDIPSAWVEQVLTELEQIAQKQLTPMQRVAVVRAFTSKISVITGKPGTGKTTSLRAVVAVAKRFGLKYALCAPTGRAAENMTKATGEQAVTIHRLLEFKAQAERKDKHDQFKKTADNQLSHQMIVLDEGSMVGTSLFRYLIDAMQDGCRLVIVGDSNQLPSVDAGRVLHDIIRSGVCPVTELDVIHRQAQQSLIITNAHRILSGESLYLPVNSIDLIHTSDFSFIDCPMIQNEDGKKIENAQWAQYIVQELCANRLPQLTGINPIRDVQILTPRKDGACGVNELNLVLQNTLNAQGKKLLSDRFGREFRQGDRVMCVKNNYDLDVFNGDIGIVRDYDLGAESLMIDFFGKEVLFPADLLSDLTLAYACTVHKSQGSEYHTVVMMLMKQHGIMLQRNLLYTGVTRAKQRLIMIGSRQALQMAIRNDKAVQRNTLLWHRLQRLKLNAA